MEWYDKLGYSTELLPLDFLKIGILLPDTVRAVTLAAADDFATVSIDKILKLCPYSTTSLSVQSVPSVTTPTDATTPIPTEAPIIFSGTFNIVRSDK